MNTPIKFYKMHSLGNDFVLVSKDDFKVHKDVIRLWGDRHRGIGFDQLIVYEKTNQTDYVKVEFYNQDGSFSHSCGNGTRALALLYKRLHNISDVTIQTKAGSIQASIDNDIVQLLWNRPQLIDFKAYQEILSLSPLFEKVYHINCGNPHLVIWIKNSGDIHQLRNEFGKILECHHFFPERINVSFAKFDILETFKINLAVFERGVGPTLACGTAALAVYESLQTAYPGTYGSEIQIQQEGGIITSKINDSFIEQKARAAFVFEGIIEQ